MAIYHLSAKTISRSIGRSATAAAAYRAGAEIADDRTGEVHDYTKKGGVLHAELILPGGETSDRSEFWNAVEKHHKRGDAVVAREVEVSLPAELTKEQRQALAVGFARELADRYSVAADVALHAPRTLSNSDLKNNPEQYHETDPETGRKHNGNWHAHILLSACHVSPDGTLGKKAVELDPIHCQRAKIENMADRERVRWGELVNAALEQAGHNSRIDHRSLKAQGIDREPTQHLGPAAAGYERRTGEVSRKREDFQQKALERLANAKLAGELERQEKEIDKSIIDLSGDIKKAREEQRARQALKPAIFAEKGLIRPEHEPAAATLELAERIKKGFFDEAREAWKREEVDKHTIRAGELSMIYQELLKDEPKKPLVFGRGEWERQHSQWQAKVNNARTDAENHHKTAIDAQGGKFDDYAPNTQAWDKKAQERLKNEHPELAKVLREHQEAERRKAEQEATRAAIAKAEADKAKMEEFHVKQAVMKFSGLAAKRRGKALGYTDGGKKWTALPDDIKAAIDEHNKIPYQDPAREKALEKMRVNLMRQPGEAEKLIRRLEGSKERSR